MPPLSKPLRLLVLVVSAAILVTAVVTGFAAAALPLLVKQAKPDMALFGFEVVTAVASVLGILHGLGKFRSGPGLGLACVAGTVFVAAVLGWEGASHRLGGVSLTPLLATRLGGAFALAAAGASTVLARRPGAWGTAITGVLLIAPVASAAAALISTRGRELIERLVGGSQAVQFIVVSIGFLIATAMLSAGVHLVIHAFEMGRIEAPATSRHQSSTGGRGPAEA